MPELADVWVRVAMGPRDTATSEARAPEQDAVPVGAVAPRYPWVVMGLVLLGLYPVVLGTTALGVALPGIANDLGTASVLDVDWVITSYLIAVTVVMAGTPGMADRWGKKHVYAGALLTFGMGSALSAVAPSMLVLVLARTLQGLGGGALMPLGLAIVYELFEPHRRGFALGILGVAVMAGPALGPPFGGWVTTAWSWRVIFYALTLLSVVAFVLVLRFLVDVGVRTTRRIDWRGWVIATAGLTSLILATRQAPSWGMTSGLTLGVGAIGVVFLLAFVVWGRRHDEPLIDFAMFQVPTFNISMGVVALLTIAQFSRLTFLPIELQFVQGRDAAEVGLMLSPAAVGVAATMPVGGWLADRIGARVPVVSGLALFAGSMWFLANLTPTTSTTAIVTILVVSGIGTGLAMMPNTVAAMNSLPNRFVNQASGVNSLNRQLAAAVGTALLGAFVVLQMATIVPETRNAETIAQAQATYNGVFLIAFVLALLTVVAAMFLPGKRQTREFQAARAVEHERITGGVVG